MNKRSNLISLTVVFVAWSSAAIALDDSAVHPPKDDPVLYSSFFFFMDDFCSWLDARVAAEPGRKTKLIESAARYVNVQPADFLKLNATSHAVAAALKRINLEAHNYVLELASDGQSPDVERIREFEAQRQTAIQAGLADLNRNISPVSWNGLHAHINGTHRASIKRRPADLIIPQQ
jgi:hypothetical protein